jgi:hypothetical protein
MRKICKSVLNEYRHSCLFQICTRWATGSSTVSSMRFLLLTILVALPLLASCQRAERGDTITPAPQATRTSIAAVPNPEPTTTHVSVPMPPTPTSTPSPTASPTPNATATRQTSAPLGCQPLPVQGERPRYRFWVESNPATHQLNIWQQITLADPLRLETGEIVLNVPANHTPGIFTLSDVQIAGNLTPVEFNLSGTTLRIVLPPADGLPDPRTLCLTYALNLPQAGGEGISGAHALAWSPLGDVAGYWYPMLAPYQPTTGYRLIPYHPVGDPIMLESADYEIAVQAPPGYTVIGSGFTGQSDNVWRFTLTSARGVALVISDQLVLTANSSARSEDGVNEIPVRIYHLNDHESAARATAQAIKEALPLFATSFGPYPYDEINIVETVQFGGMEYTGLITFSSQWFADYRSPLLDAAPESEFGSEFGADYLIRFVIHELGHQWWYGAVGNDQSYEPWLDESLARYGEWRYYATLRPEHLAWWEAPSQGMATQPINQPIYAFDDTLSYVQAVYVSGTRFLLAVQEAIGEAVFSAFLQDYYTRNQNQIVTGDEFLSLLQHHAGTVVTDLLPIYFILSPEGSVSPSSIP